MTSAAELKRLIGKRKAITVPGTANALFARAQDLGYEIVYVTGAGVANMSLSVPDIGLTTVTEVSETVAVIADVISVPLVVDGDTGFGNPLNTIRTVRLFERAGAAGIQLEDQVFPNRCGHFAGKAIISTDEMVQKIKAAVDTRYDGDLQIIARTDARAVSGLSEAVDRAHNFVDAGADVTFVEAPENLEELTQITKSISVPQVANIVFGGKTPDPGREAFAEMGFSIVLYANTVLQAALRGAYAAHGSLKKEGDLSARAIFWPPSRNDSARWRSMNGIRSKHAIAYPVEVPPPSQGSEMTTEKKQALITSIGFSDSQSGDGMHRLHRMC
jgi:2-methylisocitrate lyase-like PEP mutase family enzyme